MQKMPISSDAGPGVGGGRNFVGASEIPMEKKMKTTMVEWGILGLYWDNGKDSGNFYILSIPTLSVSHPHLVLCLFLVRQAPVQTSPFYDWSDIKFHREFLYSDDTEYTGCIDPTDCGSWGFSIEGARDHARYEVTPPPNKGFRLRAKTRTKTHDTPPKMALSTCCTLREGCTGFHQSGEHSRA